MRQTLSVFLMHLAVLLAAPEARAQTATDYAWRPIAEVDGVRLDYLRYPYALSDSMRAGAVVLKLHNTNAYAVRYRFTVIFRSVGGERAEAVAEGTIEADGGRTGTLDGLHFEPFPRGTMLAEIGLRGFRIERAEDTDML